VLTAMLDREPDAVTGRPGLLFIADKGFASKEFASGLARGGVAASVVQAGETPHGESLLQSVRQLIESVDDTLKAGSAWNSTAAGPSRASLPASSSASSRWPRRSAATTRPDNRSCDL
jgi:hypothetical protein